MCDKKQTAVEFLESNLISNGVDFSLLRFELKQAKELEKQQKEDYAVEFVKWLIDKKQLNYYINSTFEELLKIFKKEKGL